MELGKILESYKRGESDKIDSVNNLLSLMVLNKRNVKICPICNENILVNNICPKCTIELCTEAKSLIF